MPPLSVVFCSRLTCSPLPRPCSTSRAQQSQQVSAKDFGLPAGVVVAVAAAMSSPLAAEASVTPSLKNFLYSLIAGATVLGGIALAITAVSNFDPIKRG